jgi:hypothetical protein
MDYVAVARAAVALDGPADREIDGDGDGDGAGALGVTVTSWLHPLGDPRARPLAPIAGPAEPFDQGHDRMDDEEADDEDEEEEPALAAAAFGEGAGAVQPSRPVASAPATPRGGRHGRYHLSEVPPPCPR